MPTPPSQVLTTRINELIRSGKGEIARRELQAFKDKRLPRPIALQMAALARRAGLPELTIRLLNRIVRPGPRSQIRASDQEKAEYAAGLTRFGAVDEAMALLKSVDSRKVPEALLFQAHTLFNCWQYAPAIPLLQTYVHLRGLDDYERLVGKVNLAAAYVHERFHDEADQLLGELTRETQASTRALLRATILRLWAEKAIYVCEWKEARSLLEKAAAILKESRSLDYFFVQKWQAVACALQHRDRKSTGVLRRIRNEAVARTHWETVRQCDFFISCCTSDEKLFIHVYFGTPFEAFRRRMRLDYGGNVALPDSYLWELGGPSASFIFLLAEGMDERARHRMKVGQLIHRLTLTLTGDFYRPFRIPTLNAKLFPTETFNPVTSPGKVHQGINRLRNWFREARAPFVVEEKEGTYALRPAVGSRGAIRVTLRADTNPLRWSLKQIEGKFVSRPFSAAQVSALLGISRRAVQYLLQEAARDTLIVRVGSGPQTRYRITSQKI